MKIDMKNFIKIFPHIIIWVVVLIVPMYLMSREGTFDYKPYYSYVMRLGIFAILFYINYLFLIEKYLFSKSFAKYIIINIILITLLLGVHTIASDYLWHSSQKLLEIEQNMQEKPFSDNRPNKEHKGPPEAMRYLFDLSSIIFVIALSVAIKTTIRWHRDSMNFEKTKSMQLEADLRNLRSQLNPHFLFNTLNNIYSLIAIDQNRAQEAVHRLSNLLRYVMYDNDEKFVPIDKELEFTRNYIDLMKLRLNPNIKLNILIEDEGSKDLIASLMFITLIENAFKHGINNGGESFIDISIMVDSCNGVLCTVENSMIADDDNNLEKRNSGIGLTNLARRLELLYPNRHEFVTEKRSGSFFTLLRINFGKENIGS